MAEGKATRSSRGHRTKRLLIREEDYVRIVNDLKVFRRVDVTPADGADRRFGPCSTADDDQPLPAIHAS